jgi:hypothetical protein
MHKLSGEDSDTILNELDVELADLAFELKEHIDKVDSMGSATYEKTYEESEVYGILYAILESDAVSEIARIAEIYKRYASAIDYEAGF